MMKYDCFVPEVVVVGGWWVQNAEWVGNGLKRFVICNIKHFLDLNLFIRPASF